MKDMEAEINSLQQEKEELNSALLSAKASTGSNKFVLRHIPYTSLWSITVCFLYLVKLFGGTVA